MAILVSAVVALGVGFGPLTGTAAAQPTELTPPTITHNAWLGQTLQLTQGTYDNAATVTDVWWQCTDSAGTNCMATADTVATYAVGDGDVDRYIKVRETATASDSSTTVVDSTLTFQVAAQTPTSETAPTISDTSGNGTIAAGDTESAAAGTWSEPPDYITYQWLQCDGSGANCTTIFNAAGMTYASGLSDVGHTLEVRETPHYAPNDIGNVAVGATATSAASAVVHTASSMSLAAAPGSPVTNQGVTLAATVTSEAAAGAPSGSVAFLSQGEPISGCGAVPVPASGQSATAICQTSFGAGPSQLAATFTPDASSLVLGSSSPVLTLNVGRDAATTTLDASAQVPVDATTSYTATVAPATAPGGPIRPSGSVEFLDGGKPIAGCTARPVASGGATCTIRYSVTGSRSIVARYLGDANFAGSSSPAKTVRITPLSVKGTITSTMQWTFSFAPTYTRVINMVINGVPTGATVQTLCHGRGCPFAKRSTTVGKAKPCAGQRKRTHSCSVHGRVSLTAPFGDHKLHPGAQITIEIRRPRFVGKYYSFTVRARRQPGVRIGCLAPGGTRPDVGC